MVTKEELKDVLIKEEVKAIYDSIDYKELDRLEQKSIEYDEWIKKDYHPVSYQIDKEIEEEWRSAPLEKELWNIETSIMSLYFIYLAGWFFVGFYFVLYALVS